MVVGAAVRPYVCPQPTAGTTVRLVCTLSSPLPGVGLTVEWCGLCLGYLHTASLWCCFDGIWHISWGGSARCTGAGGAGLAHFAIGGPLRDRPCSTGWDDNPLEGWIHRSTALGVCVVQASLVNWFPLGFRLGDGRGRWHLPAPLFPTELSSVSRGSTTLPPSVLLPFPLSKSRAVDF